MLEDYNYEGSAAIAVCLAATVLLGLVLRREKLSLGLPFAYLVLLLLEHLPGAWAAGVAGGAYDRSGLVNRGVSLTAIGVCAFVAGVLAAQVHPKVPPSLRHRLPAAISRVPGHFVLFCLIGGWIFTFAIRSVVNLPSINAVVEKGGALWLLGVMIGLAAAVRRRSFMGIALWTCALLVYPTFVLVIGGFLSWGSASIVLVVSLLCVVIKRYWRIVVGVGVGCFLGLSLFVNYFEIRDDLRQAAWGGASISERAGVAADIFANFQFVNPKNPGHLNALDQRLNQNYFVGLAAARLDEGSVNYLNGRSIWEGIISLVPRAIWADKPVYGGSGDIVPEMTGLELDRTGTAWGVGSVMEFYINFGTAGLIGGFLLLGGLIGRLDRLAAHSLIAPRYGTTLIYFLPCVALIQPLGSLVELISGAAAALIAGVGWRWLWELGNRPSDNTRRSAPSVAGDDLEHQAITQRGPMRSPQTGPR